MRLSATQTQRVGAAAAALIGLVCLVVGGRLVLYQAMLAEPVQVSGTIVQAGRTTASRGGSVNHIRYAFVDASGATRSGTSRGYSGQPGDRVLVEYAPRFPAIHRVAGEGKNRGYAWRWPIAGFGLFFLVVGVHWGWHAGRGRFPPHRSAQ